MCSGMEQLIKSQKDAITELEGKIQANLEEIKKVATNILFESLTMFSSAGEGVVSRVPKLSGGDQPAAVSDE